MFNNKKKSASQEAHNARNHVAEGTTLKGSIDSPGGLRIDGKVEGEIDSIGKLVIGEKGLVDGNIRCKDAEIEGKIKGNITSSGLLYLKESAQVEGDISAHHMKMDPGAVFNGVSDMKAASQKAPSLNGEKKQSEKSKAKAG